MDYSEFLQEVTNDDNAKGLIKSFGDLSERIHELRRSGLPRGLSTGWPSLDEHYRIPPGQWTLVTGIPGHGKSSFLSALLINLMKNHGWKFVIFSAENLPHENFAARLIACYLGKPFHHGYNERLTEKETDEGLEFLSAHCRYIDAGLDSPTVGSILAALRAELADNPFQGVILDPWNEMSHVVGRNQAETGLIGDELGDIRRFARHSGAHVWVVAHPQKMQRSRETNEYNVPTAWDVSGSAHFRNKADFSLTIHRPEMGSRITDVHVQKVRFNENGQVGKVQLDFDPMTGRFKDQW